MYDVTYIPMKDHQHTLFLPEGVPFPIWFKEGVGGHYPEPKKQEKSGQATKGKWVKGIPNDVAEWWLTNGNPPKQGFVLSKRGGKK